MKHEMPFLTINDDIKLTQIEISDWLMVSTALAKTSLDTVDFDYVMRMRNTTNKIILREYMLLKTGMFEMWEMLYHDE